MTQGAGQDHLGIYIKSIVQGGPAERVRPFKPKRETLGKRKITQFSHDCPSRTAG